MRASFAEEKTEIFIAVTATRTLMSLWKKYVRWKGNCWFCLCFWNGCSIFNMAALLNLETTVSSSVFGATHSLFINYFPKWNIQTSYFDINKPETIESFITPNTKILLLNRLQPSSRYYRFELLGKLPKAQFDFNR
jgi:O-succinylhomoserine sulfhydrylase